MFAVKKDVAILGEKYTGVWFELHQKKFRNATAERGEDLLFQINKRSDNVYITHILLLRANIVYNKKKEKLLDKET